MFEVGIPTLGYFFCRLSHDPRFLAAIAPHLLLLRYSGTTYEYLASGRYALVGHGRHVFSAPADAMDLRAGHRMCLSLNGELINFECLRGVEKEIIDMIYLHWQGT